MNIALHNPGDSDFYIASVKKADDDFIAMGRMIGGDGKVLSVGQAFQFQDKKGAEDKVKDLIKTKIKRRRWVPIDLEKLPKGVQKFLEVPPEMQVSPEEMVMILHDAKAERYVIFENVDGLEEYFDAGVEYIGYQTEDQETVKVFDRYGTLREVFLRRMRKINLTERSLEACMVKVNFVKNREGPKMEMFINHTDFFAKEQKQFAQAVK